MSYPANIHTSRGNPVYDILLLESDGAQVHASVYPDQLPGTGLSVISHDVPFVPVKSLIIGLTEGQDSTGSDKTQIVMYLDRAFATAHVGEQFSSIFAGTRHSTTIANLQAAVAGDSAQLAWFTDTFFPGTAAAAAFDPGGAFVVAEFTALAIAGAPGTTGSWQITHTDQFQTGSAGTFNCRATQAIQETAKVNTGPFDIAFDLTGLPGDLVIDKTVVNNTGVPWHQFDIILGTGGGSEFTPSPSGDALRFIANPSTCTPPPPGVSNANNEETTGAFPGVVVGEDRMTFTGFLPPGGTAHFIVFVRTDTEFTARQVATATDVAAAPALRPPMLVLTALLLSGLAARRLVRTRPRRRSSRQSI